MSVVGYLHSVSPMKMSKNSRRYFEATLQTGREAYNRVVCFSPEKRDQFVHAAENWQAVKLVATRKSISKFCVGFPVFVSETNSPSRDMLGHMCQSQGPRATCGPPRHFMWPAILPRVLDSSLKKKLFYLFYILPAK